MKRRYSAPSLAVQPMEMGVFGDYGNDDGGSRPADVTDRFRLNME